MQCQLFCTKRTYCDFVVWTETDIHIERIYPNQSFWLENVSRVQQFFMTSILPELIGKFYSRNTDIIISPQVASEELSSPGPSSLHKNQVGGNLYCYCQSPESGLMVGCDNPDCAYQWFHLECLRLSCAPKSKHWFCPDCRKLPEFRRKRMKKTDTLN